MRLGEAFKALDALNEDTFTLSDDGIKKLAEFENNDDLVDELSVIDLDAETEEDFQDSYVGKVILDCCVCHSKLYKDKADVKIDEESQLANVGEDCPYCYTPDGFKIVGEVAKYNENDEDIDDNEETVVTEEPVKDEDNEDTDDKKVEESLNEDMNNVTVTTDDTVVDITSDDNGKVTVTTEPVDTMTDDLSDGDEVVVPVSDETITDIENTDIEEPTEAEDNIVSDDEVDLEIEDFDEESFDDLGEQYFREAYENVETFKTSSVTETKEGLMVEGVLKFTSGSTKKTSFLFESKLIDKEDTVKFIGENIDIKTGKAAFTMTGKVSENKLILESLSYNYETDDEEGNKNKVSGIVKRG